MTDELRGTDAAAELPDERQRLDRLAAEWDATQPQPQGKAIVPSLMCGMTTLRDLVYTRVHEDVEANLGSDSMLIPVSLSKIEQRAKSEIDRYQVAESTLAVGAERWAKDAKWYRDWLCRLRLNQQLADNRTLARLDSYLSLPDDDRRLEFARVLQKSIAEAAQAPLVLFRIFPLAIRIVTAVALGHSAQAQSWRDQQLHWLPAILDCQRCHGRPLENGEVCDECGNPLWKYRWLTQTD